MIELIINTEHTEYSYEYGTSSIKKTNILASVLIISSSLQWSIMQAFLVQNILYWETPLVMLSFILIMIFLAVPCLRTLRISSVIYMVIMVELLTFGVGLLGATYGFIRLSLMIVGSIFYFYIIITISSYFETTHETRTNPFCFLTTVFLSFILVFMSVYLALRDDPRIILSLGLLIIFYTITVMLIYHSVVVRSRMKSPNKESYFQMGILYFVDYVCIFMLIAMFFRVDEHMTVNLRPCDIEDILK